MLAGALVAVAGALAVVGVAIVLVSKPAVRWHEASVATHTRRALEAGE